MQLKHKAVKKSLEESENITLMDAVAPDVQVKEQPDEFATPATLFGIYKPKFESLVKELSTGELRRLILAMIEYPLNEKDFLDQSSSKSLKEAFAIGDRLFQAKMAMIISFLMEQENLAQTKLNEAANAASNEMEKANGEVQA